MTHEVLVEKVVPGGRGFARLPDGRGALISGAFPGERVRLSGVRDRGSYVEANAELLDMTADEGAAPLRVSKECPVADACGGCDWMALDLETQRRFKLELVREALRRTGGFTSLPELRIVGGAPWGYRSRIRLQLDGGRIGFHAAGSHDLVEPEVCKVSAPPLQEALRTLRTRVQRSPRAFAPFGYVELRFTTAGAPLSLFFGRREPKAGPLPRATSEQLSALRDEFLVRVEGEPVGELERMPLRGGHVLAAPGTFTQVNWEVNEALVGAVCDGARAKGLRTFADLYCGNGNFGLPLAAAGLSGRGVEVSAASIEAARRAATEQKLDAVRFEVGDVAARAAAWASAGERYDLVVVDPPRAGAKGAIDPIVRLAKESIAMVSCDPVTLARDLKGLRERGCELEDLVAFDMFPQTHHVECLAWLRAPAGR